MPKQRIAQEALSDKAVLLEDTIEKMRESTPLPFSTARHLKYLLLLSWSHALSPHLAMVLIESSWRGSSGGACG